MSFFNSEEKKNISDNNSDNDFLKPLPLHNNLHNLERLTSDTYRQASGISTTESEIHYMDTLLPLARQYSETHGISLTDSLNAVNPTEREDRWKRIKIEESDLKIGQKIRCTQPIITCNVRYETNTYYDTFALFLLGKEFIGKLTYNVKDFRKDLYNLGSHSGDIYLMQNWLRHVITFDYKHLRKLHNLENDLKIYIVNAGWYSGKPLKLTEYISLNPIIEVRSENTNNRVTELKRYVISQKINNAFEYTSIISACIKPCENDLWETEIFENFCYGFVDDVEIIINKINKKIDI